MNHVFYLLNELEGKLYNASLKNIDDLLKLRTTAWMHFEKVGSLNSDEYQTLLRRLSRLIKLVKMLKNETQW